jgi:predicted transcriptional regulator
LTIADIAKLTGKSEQSIRRAIKAGKLKAMLIDGHYEINEKNLSDYQGVSQSDSQAIVREKDALIELLRQQLSEKDQQLSQQQAIIMQLSRNQQLMLESKEQKARRSWWSRLFRRASDETN